MQHIFKDIPDPNNSLDRTDPTRVASVEDNDSTSAVRKLKKYFYHTSNPTFKCHVFRKMLPEAGKTSSQFATRLRQQGNL